MTKKSLVVAVLLYPVFLPQLLFLLVLWMLPTASHALKEPVPPPTSASFCKQALQRPVAIVTGGTRGIGSGIASALAEAGYDLLLTYNTNQQAAEMFSKNLQEEILGLQNIECKIECVGGDISLTETRDKVFDCLDKEFSANNLQVLVHNAGQYVGITSDNSDGLTPNMQLMFGDGSLLKTTQTNDGKIREVVDMATMHYYQRMYGEAFIDLCERFLHRIRQQRQRQEEASKQDAEASDTDTSSNFVGGGSIIGISSPGVTASLYRPFPGYSMPGSGKCLMEYTARVYARKAAEYDVNVNVIVPGCVQTEAWEHLAESRGLDPKEGAQTIMGGILQNMVLYKHLLVPRDIGNIVATLCSPSGKFITGIVLPCDGGIHLM